MTIAGIDDNRCLLHFIQVTGSFILDVAVKPKADNSHRVISRSLSTHLSISIHLAFDEQIRLDHSRETMRLFILSNS